MRLRNIFSLSRTKAYIDYIVHDINIVTAFGDHQKTPRFAGHDFSGDIHPPTQARGDYLKCPSKQQLQDCFFPL